MEDYQLNKKVALLIDAENISSHYIKVVFDQLSKYGIVTYKRIYGDWSSANLAGWRKKLLDFALLPMQQFQNTTKKNSSDFALVIDAMDILYSNDVDIFCIVSSDGDYTRLITRIRENGCEVVGMGEKKAPNSIVKCCDKFVYLDMIDDDEEPEVTVKTSASGKTTTKKAVEPKKKTRKLEQEKIAGAIKIIREISELDGFANFSEVYNRMIKLYSDMDPANYGYSKSSDVFASCPQFVMKVEQGKASKSVKHIYISVK